MISQLILIQNNTKKLGNYQQNKITLKEITGEDYTTECLLDHDYIKNQYRLIKVDLSRRKELDADSKAIPQIEFVGQLKILNIK